MYSKCRFQAKHVPSPPHTSLLTYSLNILGLKVKQRIKRHKILIRIEIKELVKRWGRVNLAFLVVVTRRTGGR